MTGSTHSDRVKQMVENDRFIGLFDMEVEEVSENYSRVSAVVRDEFLNGHLVAHGAFIFSLADVAFALCVNAVSDSVAVQWSMSQFRTGVAGERLTAECRLLHGGRRLRVVELVVSNAAEKIIAKGQATAIPVDSQQLRK